MTLEVAIVGGGLSGLGCARFLKQAGHAVAVFEQGSTPGGKVQTVREDGYVVELGPLGWLDKEPAVAALLDGLGLNPLLSADVQRRRLLLQHGKLHLLPSGPGSFLATPLLRASSKLRLFAEPFIPPRRGGEESIHEFATRRFGKGVAETFFGAMVSGIFGGDARALSVQAAFPLMAGWEFESGSCVRGALRHLRDKKRSIESGELAPTTGGLCNLREGMTALMEAAADSLGDHYHGDVRIDKVRRAGKEWVLSVDGEEIASASHVVIATPASIASALLGDEDPGLHKAAHGIRGASLSVVAAAYARDQVSDPLHGFGFLALRDQGFRPLGVQYASSIFPSQTPSGMVQLRVLIGGVFDPQAVDLADAELKSACLDPLGPLLGVRGEPERVWMRRIPAGIPQYTLGHLDRVAPFERKEAQNPGLHFLGDSLHGVGVNAVLKRARRVASEVAEKLQAG